MSKEKRRAGRPRKYHTKEEAMRAVYACNKAWRERQKHPVERSLRIILDPRCNTQPETHAQPQGVKSVQKDQQGIKKDEHQAQRSPGDQTKVGPTDLFTKEQWQFLEVWRD